MNYVCDNSICIFIYTFQLSTISLDQLHELFTIYAVFILGLKKARGRKFQKGTFICWGTHEVWRSLEGSGQRRKGTVR